MQAKASRERLRAAAIKPALPPCEWCRGEIPAEGLSTRRYCSPECKREGKRRHARVIKGLDPDAPRASPHPGLGEGLGKKGGGLPFAIWARLVAEGVEQVTFDELCDAAGTPRNGKYVASTLEDLGLLAKEIAVYRQRRFRVMPPVSPRAVLFVTKATRATPR